MAENKETENQGKSFEDEKKPENQSPVQPSQGVRPGYVGEAVDWVQARIDAEAGLDDEVEATLLDDDFLRRCFEGIHFPASKEVVLRCVDMEQDFIYGQDRTVNLHYVIGRIDQERFESLDGLIQSIRNRIEEDHVHQT